MIDAAYYIAAFLIVLGVLITFHELGHYLAARWCNVRVLTFSIGFGRPLWQKKLGQDGTLWVLAAFPLGGFVRMLDEREAPVAQHEQHRAFNRQTLSRRSLIVAAGPIANFVLAVLLYWIVFMTGRPELLPVLGSPSVGSMAWQAGIRNGDQVETINGVAVSGWGDFRWRMIDLLDERTSAELLVYDPQNRYQTKRIALDQAQAPDWDGDPLSDLGLVYFQPPIPARIGSVVPDSAGDKAGIQTGDLVRSINGNPVENWLMFVQEVRKSPNIPLSLEIERNGIVLACRLIPESTQQHGKEIGRVGVAVAKSDIDLPSLDIVVRYPATQALSLAIKETGEKSWFSLRMFGRMLVGAVSWKNISGPVTIADYAGRSAKQGGSSYLQFMALVSISLGILNLLPVPMLDGGHLLYHMIEVVRGRPLSERAQEFAQRVGLSLLFVLMAFALFNDANRLIFG